MSALTRARSSGRAKGFGRYSSAPASRLYVGSSPDDSVLGLVSGYNGVDRLVGVSSGSGGYALSPQASPVDRAAVPENSETPVLSGSSTRNWPDRRAGSFLQLAVVGLLAAGWRGRHSRLSLDQRRASLLLWDTWFLTVAAYLSVAGGGHHYYTVMLALAIAALVGIGVASSAMSASPMILNTEEPVISFGGYNGVDPVFSADELADLVDEGSVRFFLMPDREAIEEMMAEREANGGNGSGGGPGGAPGPGGGPGGGLPRNGSAEWIEDNCEKVPQELWQSASEREEGDRQ